MEKIPFGAYDFFGYVAPGVLFVLGLEWTIGYPNVLGQDLKPFAIAVLILAVYVAGHLIAGPAKWALEDGLARRVLQLPSSNLFGSTARPFWKRACRTYFSPLPVEIQERVQKRAAESGVKGGGEYLFLHARYHQDTLQDERLMRKLDAFVGMYGFARNMAFTCLLVSVGLVVKIGAGYGAPKDGTRSVLLFIAGVLLLYRYLKFFRQYSFELFNQFGSYKEPR